MNSIIILIPLAIPFLYTAIGGIRIAIIIPLVLFLAVIAQKKWKIKNKKIFILQFFMFVFMLSYALLTGYYDNLFAFLVFSFLLVSLSFFDFSENQLIRFMKVYAYMGVFSAIGLIIQYFFYSVFGVTFGTVTLFNNRTAFSFLWLDFSFFSLYLASLVPIIFLVFKKGSVKFLFSLLVLIASFITTARTGIFSFLIFSIFYILNFSYRAFTIGKVNSSSVRLIASIFFVSPLFLFAYPYVSSLSDREVTTGDSGRMEGYISALNYVEHNLSFGYMFDSEGYFNSVNVLPHNSLLYILTMGGIFYLFIFLTFIFLIFLNSRNKFVLSSILISLIGTMFIPSFYSMYYLGFLMSVSLAYYNLNSERS